MFFHVKVIPGLKERVGEVLFHVKVIPGLKERVGEVFFHVKVIPGLKERVGEVFFHVKVIPGLKESVPTSCHACHQALTKKYLKFTFGGWSCLFLCWLSLLTSQRFKTY